MVMMMELMAIPNMVPMAKMMNVMSFSSVGGSEPFKTLFGEQPERTTYQGRLLARLLGRDYFEVVKPPCPLGLLRP